MKLTPFQTRILQLWPKETSPSLPLRDIAYRLEAPQPTVGRSLAALEKLGLVQSFGMRMSMDSGPSVRMYDITDKGLALPQELNSTK